MYLSIVLPALLFYLGFHLGLCKGRYCETCLIIDQNKMPFKNLGHYINHIAFTTIQGGIKSYKISIFTLFENSRHANAFWILGWQGCICFLLSTNPIKKTKTNSEFVCFSPLRSCTLDSILYVLLMVLQYIPNRGVPVLSRFMRELQSPTEVEYIPSGQNSHSLTPKWTTTTTTKSVVPLQVASSFASFSLDRCYVLLVAHLQWFMCVSGWVFAIIF